MVVEDKGSVPLRNSATVRINIEDVNDQAPEFSESVYTVQLLENLPAGNILTFQYNDGDTDFLNTASMLRILSVQPPSKQ